MSEERGEHPPWRLSSLLLLVAGALGGYFFHAFGRAAEGPGWSLTDDGLGLAFGAGAAAAAVAFAFTLERQRWQWSLILAVAVAVAVAAIVYANGPPTAANSDLNWRYVALLVALAAAIPLFQAMRDEGRWRFPYVAVHWYAWTDLAALLAAGLVSALTLLLLQMVGLDLTDPASWGSARQWVLTGALLALLLGASRSLFESWDGQLWLRRALALLAPVMALLVLLLPFFAARTHSLAFASLALALVAILFTNAVLGNGPDQQSGSRLLRLSASALGALLLPLGLVAGTAVWMRVADHGYTPNRLWAAVFALGVVAIGIRYLASLVRRRSLWAEPVRRNNIRILGASFCFALLLATPLISFSSIATRDQIARLEDRRIAPADFDWRALRFQFGRSGFRALQGLREGVETPPEIRSLAARAVMAQHPGELPEPPPRQRP